MLRRVLFLSQARAEAIRPPRGAALISITDADAPPAWLPDGWVALHRAAFDDIDPEDAELDDFFEDDDYGYVPMPMAHAAAIAKAVCTARGLHFPPYELPNPFVCRLMCRALGDRRAGLRVRETGHRPRPARAWPRRRLSRS